MLTEPSTYAADLREDVDSLLDRLARIEAHRVTLRGVADSLQGTDASPTLAGVLETLERDLMLTARQADRLQSRAGGGAAA